MGLSHCICWGVCDDAISNYFFYQYPYNYQNLSVQINYRNKRAFNVKTCHNRHMDWRIIIVSMVAWDKVKKSSIFIFDSLLKFKCFYAIVDFSEVSKILTFFLRLLAHIIWVVSPFVYIFTILSRIFLVDLKINIFFCEFIGFFIKAIIEMNRLLSY